MKSLSYILNTAVLAAGLGILGQAAMAETAVNLSVLKPVQETRVIDGQETRVTTYKKTSSALPGETLTYQIDLDNKDAATSSNIDMVIPVDDNVSLVDKSLHGTLGFTAEFSVDQGQTFGDIADLKVRENGQDRPATPADVTHIHVHIPTLPGKTSAQLEYDVTVK